MSRSQNLRHNVINQVIDDMARGALLNKSDFG